MATAEKEKAERVERLRRRPLRDELGTVLTYPLKDPVAYLMMAFVVGVFAAAARVAVMGAIVGVIISTGLLYAYSFTAINRVASGDTTSFMPEISDISDLLKAVFLGMAAMLISKGPMLVLTVVVGVSFLSMIPGMVNETPAFDEEAGMPEGLEEYLESEGLSPEEIAEMKEEYGMEGGFSPGGMGGGSSSSSSSSSSNAPALGAALGALVAFPFAVLWWLLYSPIALIAAAISQSFFATLNPITGIDAIRRMGSIYWEAWVVYTIMAVVGGSVAWVLSFIPFIGPFLAAFVEAYMFLSFGCLLGFAVFKRAKELGVD